MIQAEQIQEFISFSRHQLSLSLFLGLSSGDSYALFVAFLQPSSSRIAQAVYVCVCMSKFMYSVCVYEQVYVQCVERGV